MLRLLTFILWLAAGVLVAALTAPNLHPVRVNYYLGSNELPLAVVALICLWLGALLGVIFTYRQTLALRRDNRRLRKPGQAGAD